MKLEDGARACGWLVAAGLMFALALPTRAADDPSIQGKTRAGIQAAMKTYLDAQTAADGSLLHYDPVAGTLLRLRLEKLHAGIVGKGHFYVSCADFTDGEHRYDLDFLVIPDGDAFRVNQAIVHSIDGQKRKYHVEQRWPGLF